MKHTEKQLRKLQAVHMTDVERVSVRTALIDFMERTSPSVYQSIPSPFFRYWTPVMVTMFSFAFVIFGGSAIAYNASSSLPGDFLYNFKVHVNEEVAGIFIKSDLEKITFEQYRVARRIEEVKKLAIDGTLNAENAAIAEKNIDAHIAKIDESAKALAEVDPKEFVAAAKGLEPILDAHEKDLTEITKTTTADQDPEKIEKVLPADNALVDTAVDAKLDPKADAKPLPTDTPVAPIEKTPAIQKAESKVVDSIISKVQIESDKLQNIAKPLIDKGIVKDAVVKTEIQKEIIPEATKITQ